jgi:hypothetical protein
MAKEAPTQSEGRELVKGYWFEVWLYDDTKHRVLASSSMDAHRKACRMYGLDDNDIKGVRQER